MDTYIPMTLATFRGVTTGLLLVLFLWLIAWAWSRRRKADFEAAARLPLEEEPLHTKPLHTKPLHTKDEQP